MRAAILLPLALTACMGPWREEHVSEPIRVDTLWTADTTWVLDEIVYVEQGAQLTIEPGTTILGEPGSALVVTRDASILARGARDAPIVFTSSKPEGERAAGDWGGVVLLGRASVNVPDARIEGVPEDDARGNYGGEDDSSSCGTLEWVRIAFAGFEVYQDNELNGLTLGGCGSGTLLRSVHVHRALDDGIEFFGGLVDGRNLVVTGAQDDSIDWDAGWRGRIQFLLVQQHPDSADNGIEADNNEDENDALPRSAPKIWNATFIGPGTQSGGGQRGAVLRLGTAGVIANSAFVGFPGTALDVRDDSTTLLADDGLLDVRFTVVERAGPGTSPFEVETGSDPDASDFDDDNGFDEAAWFGDAARSNVLATGALLVNAFDVKEPDFTPLPGSALDATAGPVPQGEFWDPSATGFGATPAAVGTEVPWWQGWTAFPEN